MVSTPGRDIQFTAPTQDRHELWMSVRVPIASAVPADDNTGLDFLATTAKYRIDD